MNKKIKICLLVSVVFQITWIAHIVAQDLTPLIKTSYSDSFESGVLVNDEFFVGIENKKLYSDYINVESNYTDLLNELDTLNSIVSTIVKFNTNVEKIYSFEIESAIDSIVELREVINVDSTNTLYFAGTIFKPDSNKHIVIETDYELNLVNSYVLEDEFDSGILYRFSILS